jgi:hypothetical protein
MPQRRLRSGCYILVFLHLRFYHACAVSVVSEHVDCMMLHLLSIFLMAGYPILFLLDDVTAKIKLCLTFPLLFQELIRFSSAWMYILALADAVYYDVRCVTLSVYVLIET